MVKNLIKFCSDIVQKVEFVSYELGYWVDKISKQSIKGEAWFLPATENKM